MFTFADEIKQKRYKNDKDNSNCLVVAKLKIRTIVRNLSYVYNRGSSFLRRAFFFEKHM